MTPQPSPPGTQRAFRDSTTSAATLIPNLQHLDEMLAYLGIDSVDALFEDIPTAARIPGLAMEGSMGERQVVSHLARLANRNKYPGHHEGAMPVFLGAGLKEHYVPSPVRALIARSEFYTSYTPYQPEVSQGILQSLFEFQSMLAELAGMDVANISQYDWATAIGEAALLCARAGNGTKFLVPAALTPEKRSVVENYVAGAGLEVVSVPNDPATGTLDVGALDGLLASDVVGLYIETPNLFGVWEPEAPNLKARLESKDAGLLVVGADPLSLALAEGPGSYGADIVVGELAGYGTPIAYGGPLLGIFAVKQALVRKMPGRLVGVTRDDRGNHCFTLTLQTREQHIRRARAMSNICTNETLLAVAAAIYLGLTGGVGLSRLAAENEERAHGLRDQLNAIPGITAAFGTSHFDEFTLTFDRPYREIHEALLDAGIHGGYDLGQLDATDGAGPAELLARQAVFATTEVHSPEDHDRLVAALHQIMTEAEDPQTEVQA